MMTIAGTRDDQKSHNGATNRKTIITSKYIFCGNKYTTINGKNSSCIHSVFSRAMARPGVLLMLKFGM